MTWRTPLGHISLSVCPCRTHALWYHRRGGAGSVPLAVTPTQWKKGTQNKSQDKWVPESYVRSILINWGAVVCIPRDRFGDGAENYPNAAMDSGGCFRRGKLAGTLDTEW